MPRLEDGTIVMNNFQAGVGPSCYLGVQEIRGLDVFTRPGVAFPNYAMTKESATTVDGLLLDMRIDPLTGIVYGYTSTKIFTRATNGAWSAITGHGSTASYAFVGMFIWKSFSASGSYIFFIHSDGNIDVYDSSTGQSWTNNWKNAWIDVGGSSILKPAIVAANDKVYIGNGTGNYGLYSIEENAGETFDPDTAGTYTLSGSTPALDFPSHVKTKTLAEIGNYLLTGTYVSYDDTKATIYPWNKSDASFDNPIEIGEDTCWKMVSKNNRVYINAGKTGKIYITDGTSVDVFAKFPETMVSNALANPDNLFPYSQNGMAVNGDEILFGWHGSFTGANSNFGVYSIDIKTGSIVLKNLISTGHDGTSEEIYIGAILPLTTRQYLVSWYDSTSTGSYGVDKVNTARYLTDEAYIIDQFYRVATRKQPKTYDHLEIQLTKALSTNDSVKVYYRTAQNGSWTLIKSLTAAVQSYNSKGDPAVIIPKNIENIQLKVILNNTAELLEVRLV